MLVNPSLPPQEPKYKALEVTHKETGERIMIKDFRFNPEIHEKPKAEIGTQRVEVATPEPEFVPKITEKERFMHLQSKGWTKLDKGERVDYQKLKERLKGQI